jgi:hypothetical protein
MPNLMVRHFVARQYAAFSALPVSPEIVPRLNHTHPLDMHEIILTTQQLK